MQSPNNLSKEIVDIKLSINNLRESLVINEIIKDLNQESFNNSFDSIFEIKDNSFSEIPSWFPKGIFTRSHKDLIAEYDNKKILLKDYFTLHQPPSVETENGLHFKGSIISHLSQSKLSGQYVQDGNESNILSIGEVSTIDGTVNASRNDGNIFKLSTGDPVFQGDVIKCESGGSVGITFIDKTTLSLSDGGKMVLDELVFDPSSGVGTMAVDMLEGAFSFISGEIAKSGDEAMNVSTPVATIGIRGTSVAGKAAIEGNENSFTLLQDSDGSVGQISISNSAGTQTLSQVGATTSISSFNTPPPPPIILSAAQIQANYGDALEILPPTPINAPEPQTPPPPQEDSQDSSEVEVEGEGEEEVLAEEDSESAQEEVDETDPEEVVEGDVIEVFEVKEVKRTLD